MDSINYYAVSSNVPFAKPLYIPTRNFPTFTGESLNAGLVKLGSAEDEDTLLGEGVAVPPTILLKSMELEVERGVSLTI